MSSAQLASADGRIEKQFRSLKFGQPSLLALDDGSYLAVFWQAKDENYMIQIRKIAISA